MDFTNRVFRTKRTLWPSLASVMVSTMVLTTQAIAAETSPAPQEVSEPSVAPETGPVAYQLDNDHTHITWTVDRFGFAKTVGSFADVDGTLMLNEAHPGNSQVSAKISLAGLRSDHVEREDIVRGEYWLDAATFPTIEFASSDVRVHESSDGVQTHADVDGNLTLRGVTRPVTMQVTLNKMGIDPVTRKKAAGFSAVGSFNRSDFDINIAQGPIGDEITFKIEALAIAEE